MGLLNLIKRILCMVDHAETSAYDSQDTYKTPTYETSIKSTRYHKPPDAGAYQPQSNNVFRPTIPVTLRPSGGYQNFSSVKVRGLNSATNRRKAFEFQCHQDSSIESIATEMGLLPPYEIEGLMDDPSVAQLKFAKNLNIVVPPHASALDVSTLISRLIDADGDAITDIDPSPDLIQFANNRKICFSYCIGRNALYNLVFRTLQNEDRIAFFCFCVYRFLSKDKNSNLDISPHKKHLYEFAQAFVDNKEFVSSMNKNLTKNIGIIGKFKTTTKDGDRYTINGISQSTIAYKKAEIFINNRIL